MKKLIIMALVSIFAVNGFANEAETKAIETAKENNRLCKIFTHKVETYKSTMREDSLAEATLVSYEKRASKFCDTTVEKSEEKTVVAAQTESKAVSYGKKDARLCNIFSKKVEKYESTMRNDDLAKATLDSYKVRMASFCGSSSSRS